MLELKTEMAEKFVSAKDYNAALESAKSALKVLLSGQGRGGKMNGWLTLPKDDNKKLIADCQMIANRWINVMDVVVVVGIGGSFLGAKCALEAFSHSFASAGERNAPHIVFAGYSLSEDYMSDLLGYLKKKSYGLIVISKSGTTLESALAFRILRKQMIDRFGVEDTRRRIITVTDQSNGALRAMSEKYGYVSLSLPGNVGGRYSVLSAVGLLPIAVAGFNIENLLGGANEAMNHILEVSDDNPALRYAALRNLMYKSGKKIEVFINYHPKLKYLGEWLKQLFAESEGKEHKGLFPATLDLTTDLHSVGQYIQDGERIMFETAILAGSKEVEVIIPSSSDNLDGLDYLKGWTLENINRAAEEGTRMAHTSGGVPNIYIELEKIDEWNMGMLFYFFEVSCAVSAYMLGVNPFDQPAVEVYKNNLYKLLGRPSK
ncbi:MAG: glucose-6-phosphate isomerase [Bacteroidales bacterium]|nr:glucose-6-phosphate isomerase [Bacteroidales bacterium]